MLKIQIITGAVSILVLVIVFELIRRRRLKEEYALLWLLSGAIILIFSIFPNLLIIISRAMGMFYLTALFVISFIFLLLIVLHFSIVISRLSERNKELTQELSIMDFRFKELDKRFHELISERE
ncbi:MAG: DUF2304 domain-containing protein [Planctomycetota bacterium]|jgi:hypothetical protein